MSWIMDVFADVLLGGSEISAKVSSKLSESILIKSLKGQPVLCDRHFFRIRSVEVYSSSR